jgi:hypothetical protein
VNPKIGAAMTFDKALRQDAVTIGSDALFVITAALVLFGFPATFWAALMGAFGAMLPDPLQFAYAHWRHEPLVTLQRFHQWAHSKRQIKSVALGISTQTALVALVIGLTAAFHHSIFAPATAMVRHAG